VVQKPEYCELEVLQVAMTEIPVEHSVKLKEFRAWLDRPGGRARERSQAVTTSAVLKLGESNRARTIAFRFA
jgi:hypothetical protein